MTIEAPPAFTERGFDWAAGIISFEKSSGLFIETSIQGWVINHIQLTEALNYFYLYAHWTITPLFFIWLYKRRNRVYPYVRNAFLAANGIAIEGSQARLRRHFDRAAA